jgi:hypothetical protein
MKTLDHRTSSASTAWADEPGEHWAAGGEELGDPSFDIVLNRHGHAVDCDASRSPFRSTRRHGYSYPRSVVRRSGRRSRPNWLRSSGSSGAPSVLCMRPRPTLGCGAASYGLCAGPTST